MAPHCLGSASTISQWLLPLALQSAPAPAGAAASKGAPDITGTPLAPVFGNSQLGGSADIGVTGRRLGSVFVEGRPRQPRADLPCPQRAAGADAMPTPPCFASGSNFCGSWSQRDRMFFEKSAELTLHFPSRLGLISTEIALPVSRCACQTSSRTSAWDRRGARAMRAAWL